MTDRRVHWRRRLTAWLVAAVLGAAGALSVVTPAHAAETTCTVTFRQIYWPAIEGRARWMVEGTMTNTGTANSTNWWLGIHFPAGAVVPLYWNVTKSPAYVFLWYAADWYKVLA